MLWSGKLSQSFDTNHASNASMGQACDEIQLQACIKLVLFTMLESKHLSALLGGLDLDCKTILIMYTNDCVLGKDQY